MNKRIYILYLITLYTVISMPLKAADQNQQKALTLKYLTEYQAEHHNRLLESIDNDALTTLYKFSEREVASKLRISPELLESNKDQLPTLFAKNNLVTSIDWFPGPWNKEDWQQAFEVLTKRNEQPTTDITPDRLLLSGKNILKAFLPPDNFYFPKEQRSNLRNIDRYKTCYVKKIKAIGRIFTYIKLKKVIQDRHLTHIHLPFKFLVIKDEDTKQYITGKQAMEDILEKYIKIIVSRPSDRAGLYYSIPTLINDSDNDFNLENNYKLRLFTQKVNDSGKPFNKIAFNQLQQLVEEAPFDVGAVNIYSDDKGDAVIIDTEFKGESASTTVQKLKTRYARDK